MMVFLDSMGGGGGGGLSIKEMILTFLIFVPGIIMIFSFVIACVLMIYNFFIAISNSETKMVSIKIILILFITAVISAIIGFSSLVALCGN